jgi:hypothetical protein
MRRYGLGTEEEMNMANVPAGSRTVPAVPRFVGASLPGVAVFIGGGAVVGYALGGKTRHAVYGGVGGAVLMAVLAVRTLSGFAAY